MAKKKQSILNTDEHLEEDVLEEEQAEVQTEIQAKEEYEEEAEASKDDEEEDEEPKLKVAVYIRVSNKEQEEKYSVPHQERSIQSYLGARTIQLEPLNRKYLYYDRITGASDIKERPGLRKLFEDLNTARDLKLERPFDIVIVYRIDRFARKVKVLLEIVDDLQMYGVDFASCYESIDTSTAFGKAMLQIMGVFAELERDMITTKTHSGLRVKKSTGGRAQEKYGYKRDMSDFPKIYEPEAKVIRDMFHRFVYEDLSILKICKRLEEKKIKNPTYSKIDKVPGKKHPKRSSKGPYHRNDKTVRDQLKDEVYLGIFYYNKTKRVQDPNKPNKKIQKIQPKEKRLIADVKHAPIVDKETFDGAQEKFSRRSRQEKNTRSEKSSYLLSGLLYCDTCKDFKQRRKGMVTRVGNKGGKSAQQYMCKGKHSSNKEKCPCMPLPRKELEVEIVKRVRKLFKNPEILREYLDKSKYVRGRSTMVQKQLDANLSQQHELNLQIEKLDTIVKISTEYPVERYDQEKKDLKGQILDLKMIEKDFRQELSEYVELEKYEKSLSLMQDLLRDKREKVFEDKKKLRMMLKLLVKRIVIYSAPKPDDFVVPGPKVQGQYLANRIGIHFRLPQEILNALFNQAVFLADETEKDRAKRAMGFGQNYITTPKGTKFVEIPLKDKDGKLSSPDPDEELPDPFPDEVLDLNIKTGKNANPHGKRGPLPEDDTPRPERVEKQVE